MLGPTPQKIWQEEASVLSGERAFLATKGVELLQRYKEMCFISERATDTL